VAANRTERLLNLVMCLLYTRRYISREQIRTAVPQYAASESDEAFERMFERDKDDLREMGIPLLTGSDDPWFDDEVGYRIPREEYVLPEVRFTPAELAVVGIAAQTWQQATLAQAATTALHKLQASGVDADPDALALVEPRVAAAEPSFGALYQAVRDRRAVTFAYRSANAPSSQTRHVAPWGVVSWHGRWYLVGHDLDKETTRVFRLSRIDGAVSFTSPSGSVEIPDDLDLRAQVTMLAPAPQTATAVIDARSDRAHPLHRRAVSSEDAPDSYDDAGWRRLQVRFSDAETLAAELCGYGPDVVAVGPPEVRAAVVRRLAAIVATGRAS